MNIHAVSASIPTLQQQRLEQDRHIQSVFSQVLLEAGRPGYASAEPLASDQPLETQVQQSWESWFGVQRQQRYQGAENAAELGKEFGDVALRAYHEGAYAEPKAFLASLSTEELETVQHIHWLAEPIQVDQLTPEGALNLLIPPAAQIDLNRDGLTQTGAGFLIRFPDSNTPPAVAQAWDEATEGMSWREKSFYTLQMKLPALMANFVVDAEGRYSHHYEPGDPNFMNPMDDDDFSYVQVTSDYLGYLKAYKSQIDPVRYEKGTAFWTDFQQRLIARGE